MFLCFYVLHRGRDHWDLLWHPDTSSYKLSCNGCIVDNATMEEKVEEEEIYAVKKKYKHNLKNNQKHRLWWFWLINIWLKLIYTVNLVTSGSISEGNV